MKSQVLKGLGNDNFDWSDTDRASDEEGVAVDLKIILTGSGDIDNRRGAVGWFKNGNVGDDECIPTLSSAKYPERTSSRIIMWVLVDGNHFYFSIVVHQTPLSIR
jgi:hypothetical protein